MALGINLSTLADLGRAASYGVQQQSQAREENSERELAKDWMRASVTADYGDIINKLNQGYYRNARPELLNRAGQSISQGLQLQRKEERDIERYNREQEARERAEIRENKRYEDRLAAEEKTRQRREAIDTYDIAKEIRNESGGGITMEEAWPLAAERYKARITEGYTPPPPTGKTLIEQEFKDLSKFRGEELETKKKELAKDIREAHYNEEITPDDYEKYMRQLQRHGRGVAFGLGRAGSDIFQGVSGLMASRPGEIFEKTLGSAYEGLTAPRIQAPQRQDK